MEIHEPKKSEREVLNSIVTHPLQAWEWGEFREKTGIKVIRRIFLNKKKIVHAFQLTIHRIPRTNYTIGYIPKGLLPTQEVIDKLRRIGKEEKCIFIKLEPNVEKDSHPQLLITNYKLLQSPHPLFTKYTFHIDLTKSEDELLKAMHHKTRYNIRVAQRHGVTVEEDNSDEAFEEYIRLMHETTRRQKYYAHDEEYYRKMWKTLRLSVLSGQLSVNGKPIISSSVKPTDRKLTNQKPKTENRELITNNLTAHLLVAKYKKKILVTWIVFRFNNVLYYPYGASSNEQKEVMASNLMMWDAIRFGKKMGCKVFDMWGSLGPNPDSKDPWYGFHRFKEGYGGKLIEFVGSYDLVLNPFLYQLYNLAHRARWLYLHLKK